MFTQGAHQVAVAAPHRHLGSAPMVVELLTFRIDPVDHAAWLAADAEVWTAFLATVDGFEAKQVWVADDDPWRVEAVIWWRSKADWDAVTPEQVAAVDAAMGELRREPTCRSLRVAAVFPA